jgi:formate dehydrogenase major subunit
VVGAQEARLVGRGEEKWVGDDVPDFPVDKRPDYRADPDAKGMDAIGGTDPFIMLADGRGWLFAPSGLLDGPLPTHYEPLESPSANPLYPELQSNPAALRWTRPTTSTRARGRALPVRADDVPPDRAPHGRPDVAQPAVARRAAAEMFVEIDPVLARLRGSRTAAGAPCRRRARRSRRGRSSPPGCGR